MRPETLSRGQNMKIGDRIDVYEVLPDNDFAAISGQSVKVGQYVPEIKYGSGFGGVWIGSLYGECYCYPIEHQLKKVGTLIIKTIK